MKPKAIQVAAYYFPNYHVDPRNEEIHGPGWTEWELVKTARSRFPGHQQPKVPLWGFLDEADPAVMAQKIDAAADHGLNAFLFDWYWYENRPYLQRCLENGFMAAPNAQRLKFALMWANHDWHDMHPISYHNCYNPKLLFPGAVNRAQWDTMTDYIVDTYFSHPSYWTLDNKPFFQVYELFKLIEGLGGPDAARRALDAFRNKTVKAGFTDLHLNAVVWGVKILPGEKTFDNPAAMLKALAFDSVTSYVMAHHIGMTEFPFNDYPTAAAAFAKLWPKLADEFQLPYFPNVSMGWDSSPRTVQSDSYVLHRYTFGPILHNNTPEHFGQALRDARNYLETADLPDSQRILTINAWNEWTEGSYLEPDQLNGLAYLQAIKTAFGEV